MNTERRKFLKVAFFGGVFLLFAKSLAPLFSFSQKYSSKDKNVFAGLDKKESDKEIIFSDKSGNKVLVVEK